ncbi:MAG: bifunctional diaminohydroxyphosphoribosylaminopyrimidine deaminase/5-amino-6-(5-phosphoribosylamino)uracil reductase RibD [Nitrospirota bacterium]
MNSEKKDEYFMRLALRLAEKGKGKTNPNPLVGAVVVKNGRVCGRGYHKKAGMPHAEKVAIEDAGSDAKGATLYVNLEPCCHHEKKTPPCTSLIANSGITRVVIGCIDPNPYVSGRGIKELDDAGIEVTTGILEEESKRLNEVFFKYITTKKPFVILKAAITIDGKIATSTGKSQWITGEKARQAVHRLRNQVDAVLVGIGTILKDNPNLTARTKSKKAKDPCRVIVDSLLNIPLDSNVLIQKSSAPTYIVTTKPVPEDRVKHLKDLGAKILFFDSINNHISLNQLMIRLGEIGITSVMIEGGSRINASALRERIVDKIILFVAPKILGGKNAIGMVGGISPESLEDAIVIKWSRLRRVGDDIMVEGYVV